jgi:hypothetical protein
VFDRHQRVDLIVKWGTHSSAEQECFPCFAMLGVPE